MRIDVYFTPLGPKEGDTAGRGVVVIDILRATTTIVTALANGAKAVVPAATSEEAVRLTSNLEKNGYLLAGERRSLKIEGFQLGNSPREMTPDVVRGKTIFLATTNGTPALVAAHGAEPILVGAAANFKAVVERARQVFLERQELAIICAGRDRQFALEDAYTAGRIVKALKRGTKKLALNDAGQVALALTSLYDNWEHALTGTAAARQLAEVDLAEDIAFAAKQDRFDTVPVYAERRIT
jgi:2-phosphosulfolactate phosphatase